MQKIAWPQTKSSEAEGCTQSYPEGMTPDMSTDAVDLFGFPHHTILWVQDNQILQELTTYGSAEWQPSDIQPQEKIKALRTSEWSVL